MKTTYEVNLAGTTLRYTSLRAAKAAMKGRHNVWRVVNGTSQLVSPVAAMKDIDRRVYAELAK